MFDGAEIVFFDNRRERAGAVAGVREFKDPIELLLDDLRERERIEASAQFL